MRKPIFALVMFLVLLSTFTIGASAHSARVTSPTHISIARDTVKVLHRQSVQPMIGTVSCDSRNPVYLLLARGTPSFRVCYAGSGRFYGGPSNIDIWNSWNISGFFICNNGGILTTYNFSGNNGSPFIWHCDQVTQVYIR